MPTFDTPEPITVIVELGAGDIRITAADRTDTVVEVGPSDPSRKSHVAAADQTRVEYAAGRLVVKAPRRWRTHGLFGGREGLDVRIGLPAGSQVQVEAGMAALEGTGRLGECRVTVGMGEIRLERCGSLQLRTGMGDVTVGRVAGHAEVTTGSGALRIGAVEGTAVVKNHNGDTWVGDVTGDLRCNASNGTISVDRAGAGVSAKTANGDVRLGEVAAGSVLAQTACGSLDIAVRPGVAAWLDLTTSYGHVRNHLDDAGRPAAGEDTVEVRARTSAGDITVRRSAPIGAAAGSEGP